MATLVFSTIGTALGGPVGSAIGALIGQSIDQQVLAPPSRGPRLGDLSVQSSSYGTQIPRVYGTMRVAGSVIWSTDLVESTQTSGAKGQPDVVYSYSVSLAVALSSRRIGAVRRIWADGKLIRGDDEQFKISTVFRFYDGSEDQIVDPLIGSIEGIANTPAYRGIALAVFENLELAEFGNRIPFLTFEVADETGPAIAAILGDASQGLIACDIQQPIGGYAAYGRSTKAAVEPLVTCFTVDLFDDGWELRSPPAGETEIISRDELGNSADDHAGPRIRREQLATRDVPSVLRLSYYDAARDYQAGEARARASDEDGNEEAKELPAVVDAKTATGLAQQLLAGSWANREKIKVALPPRYLDLEPGTRLELECVAGQWIVEKCTVDGFALVAELRPCRPASIVNPAMVESAIFTAEAPADEVSMALFDVPDVFEQSSNGPVLLLAASTPVSGWSRRAVNLSFGDRTIVAATARRKSILGRALTGLGPGASLLIDAISTVDVELVDPDQWLTNCDVDALADGINLAAIGSELIQFGEAIPLGGGRFRLRTLLRGRGGTEWAAAAHQQDEPFALIEAGSLQPICLPRWAKGCAVTASIGGASTDANLSAESLRPPSPIDVAALSRADGGVDLSWTRRSRKGWAWIDEVDAPPGEAREEYRVSLLGPASIQEFTADQPWLAIPPDALSAAGPGPLAVQVRQIGDWAVSRPAEISLVIP